MRYVIVLLLMLPTGITFGQFYSTGQDPASAKWKQINTENFQVIFQEKFEKKGQQIANILEFYYSSTGKTLNHSPKKISVIVHNQTMNSNGYVAWAPKRMELSATPPQDAFPDPWLEYLCIHELRHVVQLDKLNQGITKVLSIVFGEQATGLVAGQLPMWYYEGDAVSTETALLKYGRGRLPKFERGIRTHLLSQEKNYSFDKMAFGSYKDYVPNHYELGYQLTAYTRAKYGEDIWSKVESHVAKNSYTLLPTPFAFYRGLKKYTGLSQEQLYLETMNYLDSLWSSHLEGKDFNRPNYFQNYKIEAYENYLNPLVVDDQKLIALKKGLSHIPQFVLVGKQQEEVLYEPGYLISNDYSYANNILTWAEYQPDLRWENREFTNIKLLNVETGADFELVHKSRYFSPDLSQDASRIAVVKVDINNKSSLVILNTFNGKVEEEINTAGGFIQKPKWSEDGKYIYVIEVGDSFKRVSRYYVENKDWETVFISHHADIQRIVPTKDYVFFHSTLNGIDNVYAYDLKSEELYQLSESKYGIAEFDYNANRNELVTNEYTSQGFRLSTIPVERALWRKVNLKQPFQFEFAEILTQQEKEKRFNENESEVYEVRPYRKYLNQFNFHSWIPAYVDYENMDFGNLFNDPSDIYEKIYPGITLLSQNKLSTTDAIVGYAYKDGNHYFSSSVTLKGQYPIFRLTANYGSEQMIQTTQSTTWSPPAQIGYSYEAQVYIPFNISKGKFIKGIRPSVSVEYFDNLYYNYQNNYYIEGLELMRSELLLYSYERRSQRDIIPNLGAVFEFNLLNTPFESELYGYLYNVYALFYLPGMGNSGFKINIGYQYQNPDLYLFGSNFSFPRGTLRQRTERMARIYSDYVFPIAYPDWNLGSVLYIKRIRGDLFLDYAYNSYRTLNNEETAIIWPNNHHSSFGIELTADYHLLRSIFPLSTGARFGYSVTDSGPFFEFLFGIDLYSF